MNDKLRPPCDVCGELATNSAVDIVEVPSDSAWKEYEFYGKCRFGCEKHRTKPHVYRIGDPDYPIGV